jgi:hypothetical protein
MKKITLTGWNVWATRFVEPPTWSWNPAPEAASYVVQLAAEYGSAKTYKLREPRFDTAAVWESLPHGAIDMLVLGLDEAGGEVCTTLHKRFYKVPGFAGDDQEPLDWVGAVRRNLVYLLAPARDGVAGYEQGLPRSCWSSFEDNVTGQRTHLAYPALHHPSFILTFLAFAQRFPDDLLAVEALRQARQYGDWLLHHQLPSDWVCSLFPFSTIQNGHFEGGVEGKNITLFRAARVGEAMVALHQAFPDERYLAYARHLADIFVKLQRDDGSWPYRVNPQDGSVAEEYTSNAISPARLFGLLEEIAPSSTYAQARRQAAQWVLDHPVKTRLWQGMYEDVGQHEPYRNLQHWDTNETIRYLMHYRHEITNAVTVAQELNRYIEDQFVVWQPEDASMAVRCPAPTVLEQYLCYYPMEVHTGAWLLSLLALHQATREPVYLRKGIAAANSIVQGQQPSGAFSTWGNDQRFDRPLRTSDWPGCNACAATALLRWDAYCRALQTDDGFELGLWGI